MAAEEPGLRLFEPVQLLVLPHTGSRMRYLRASGAACTRRMALNVCFCPANFSFFFILCVFLSFYQRSSSPFPIASRVRREGLVMACG